MSVVNNTSLPAVELEDCSNNFYTRAWKNHRDGMLFAHGLIIGGGVVAAGFYNKEAIKNISSPYFEAGKGFIISNANLAKGAVQNGFEKSVNFVQPYVASAVKGASPYVTSATNCMGSVAKSAAVNSHKCIKGIVKGIVAGHDGLMQGLSYAGSKIGEKSAAALTKMGEMRSEEILGQVESKFVESEFAAKASEKSLQVRTVVNKTANFVQSYATSAVKAASPYVTSAMKFSESAAKFAGVNSHKCIKGVVKGIVAGHDGLMQGIYYAGSKTVEKLGPQVTKYVMAGMAGFATAGVFLGRENASLRAERAENASLKAEVASLKAEVALLRSIVIGLRPDLRSALVS